VLTELPPGLPAIVVDDGSATPITVSRPDTSVIRHPENRGYGAAQKSGFQAALEAGATRVVLLHGDGQYATAATLALADALDEADAALGSRFLADPAVIPAWRRWGNRALTGYANLRLRTSFSELHTGARAYTAAALHAVPLATLSDDFLFDQQLIVAVVRAGLRVAERPVGTRYDDTTRSISLARSIRYGLGCVRVLTTRATDG
jgi:glycosyltransferase involved in cell wall biosynthesis